MVVEFEFVENKEKAKEIDLEFEPFSKIQTVHEDSDILVLNKPPFLTIHDAPSVKEPTLVDWLKKQNISLSTISGEIRHGIVHRLDKETSGAIVIAKNNDAHNALSLQLQDKSMGRYYLAIITPPLKEDVVVEQPIGRNPKNRVKMAVVDGGKEAKSFFVKLALSNDERFELIACKLDSGRTHQIRVHLNYLSRHIAGDYLYGFKKNEGKINRVLLHAYLLYLKHPTNRQFAQYKAEIVDDFMQILDKNFSSRSLDEILSPDYIVHRFDIFKQRMSEFDFAKYSNTKN
jgi:23S rRNA pseudouridine1911/1915/1917 synthase